MTKHKKKPENMTPWEKFLEKIKFEVADELGLTDKIKKQGWENLTAREAGQVGGYVSRRLRKQAVKKYAVTGKDS